MHTWQALLYIVILGSYLGVCGLLSGLGGISSDLQLSSDLLTSWVQASGLLR